MDRIAMLKLRNEAEERIKGDPTLYKKWCGSPWPAERELLMAHAISCIVYERGYREGWYDSEARSMAIAAEEEAGADY
jgi:hypothetical protein